MFKQNKKKFKTSVTKEDDIEDNEQHKILSQKETFAKPKDKVTRIDDKLEDNKTDDSDDDDDDDHEDNASDISEEEEINSTHANLKNELATMSFEELQNLEEKLGSKIYNQAVFGGKSMNVAGGKKSFKRENKNRPMEMTAKRPVKRHKEVVEVKKKLTRDPRFDDLSGTLDETLFKKSYSFIDDVKKREKQELEKQLKTCEDNDEKRKIKYLLGRMKQHDNYDKQKEKHRAKEKMIRQKEKGAVLHGKIPFFLKKSEKKKLELADKFKELKESGNLQNYLAKKRKKIESKDKKHLPSVNQKR